MPAQFLPCLCCVKSKIVVILWPPHQLTDPPCLPARHRLLCFHMQTSSTSRRLHISLLTTNDPSVRYGKKGIKQIFGWVTLLILYANPRTLQLSLEIPTTHWLPIFSKPRSPCRNLILGVLGRHLIGDKKSGAHTPSTACHRD